MGTDATHSTGFLNALSTLDSHISRAEALETILDNFLQCLTTLTDRDISVCSMGKGTKKIALHVLECPFSSTIFPMSKLEGVSQKGGEIRRHVLNAKATLLRQKKKRRRLTRSTRGQPLRGSWHVCLLGCRGREANGSLSLPVNGDDKKGREEKKESRRRRKNNPKL